MTEDRLRNFSIVFVGFVALVLSVQSSGANKNMVDYDRLRAVEKFLSAVYPQLVQMKGLLTAQTDEFNSYGGRLYLDFVACRPGSGVSGGGEKPVEAHCNGYIGSINSEFLRITLEAGSAKFPIHRFNAQGKFVLDKQNALLADIKAHPEWKDSEKLAALTNAGAKFGPENKDGFLNSVPTNVIFQFSACRLDLKTASFGVDYGWSIQGTYRSARKVYPCHATFEPFEGKLIGLDEV